MTRALLLAALLALGVAGANGLLVSYPGIPPLPALEAELLAETNAARARHGLAPVLPDESLALAARHHAADMAELGYLAHESPHEDRRSLSQRLNRSGAMMEAAAENLAYLNNSPDLAASTVQGWLDSPGHRANLLGRFNLVGFGIAQSPSGGNYIVQVLGLQTVGLHGATVREATVPVLKLELSVQVGQPADVGIWLASRFQGSRQLTAGTHVLSFPIEPGGPVHVNTASKRIGAAAEDPFIAADSGWFDPAAGSWSPSAGGGSEARVVGARAVRVEERRWNVELELTTLPATRLGLWLNDQWQPDFQSEGRLMRFHVPASSADGSTVSVGFEEPAGSGSYIVFGHFRLLRSADGSTWLQAINPGS